MVVMMTTTAIVLVCVGILAVFTYLIGLYDRPKITQGLLLPGAKQIDKDTDNKQAKEPPNDNPEKRGDDDDGDGDSNAANENDDKDDTVWTPHEVTVFAIVATSKEKRTQRLEKLLNKATLQGILAIPEGDVMLDKGSLAYLGEEEDGPNRPKQLSVAFRFDKTHEQAIAKVKQSKKQQQQDPTPRWAMGWLVRDDTVRFEELQALVSGDEVLMEAGLKKAEEDDPNQRSRLDQMKGFIAQFKKASGLDTDELRVIRLSGDTPVLRGSFPWRTPLSPSICAAIQWNRSLREFQKSHHQQQEEQPQQSMQEQGKEPQQSSQNLVPVAMEVYVRKPKWFTSRVDFNLVLGQNESVWEDAFPGFTVREGAGGGEELPHPQSDEAKKEEHTARAEEDEAGEPKE